MNFGNSGGPIVDEKTGSLAGMAVGGIRNESVEGINFAIKNTTLVNFLESNSIDYQSTSNTSNINNLALSEILEKNTVYVICQ